MNRHARRSDMRVFRRFDLLTHCIAADDAALERHQLLKDAAENFLQPRAAHQPFCIGCKAPFVDGDAEVGGYLFAMPVSVDGLVATSAFCAGCWQTLPVADIERISTRVLRKLAPGGKFLDQQRSGRR